MSVLADQFAYKSLKNRITNVDTEIKRRFKPIYDLQDFQCEDYNPDNTWNCAYIIAVTFPLIISRETRDFYSKFYISISELLDINLIFYPDSTAFKSRDTLFSSIYRVHSDTYGNIKSKNHYINKANKLFYSRSIF